MRARIFLLAAALGLSLAAGSARPASAQAESCTTVLDSLGGGEPPAATVRARLAEVYGQRPLAFEENRGQTDGRVRFLSRGQGYTLFLTPAEAVLTLGQGDVTRVLRLRWVGADPVMSVAGLEELPSRSHYFLGSDRASWRTGIPSYARVRYEEVYPGTDLVFYGNQRQLEHDFVLAPGADPLAIRLAVQGADRARIDPAGGLVLELGGGEVRLRKPVAYQEMEGERREVASGWWLIPAGGSASLVGFQLAAYDPALPLVIDPVLDYSTYLGGSAVDRAHAVAADAAGNAYVTGETSSIDFPAAGLGPRGVDAYVTKLASDGSLVYSIFLGGSAADSGQGIAVMRAGTLSSRVSPGPRTSRG